MNPRKAVVLLSGGLDSYTAAAMAREEGFELYALTVRYRQRHAHELEAARAVARWLGVAAHLEVGVDLAAIGGSSLTGSEEVPKDRDLSSSADSLPPAVGPPPAAVGESKDSPYVPKALGPLPAAVGESKDSPYVPDALAPPPAARRPPSEIPSTYVPARNTIFLGLALGWAEVIGARDIVIGVTAIDYSGYPDCRPEYIAAFERLAALATRAGVEGERFRVRTPLIALAKGDIVRRGVALGLDYGLTHSCYDPDAGGRPCGRCDSCRLRARGFADAGVADPLLARGRLSVS